MVLNSKPTASVTIAIATSNASEGTTSVSFLAFTPDNWDTPQTVTVTGVDDGIFDADTPYRIILTPAVSDDPKIPA